MLSSQSKFMTGLLVIMLLLGFMTQSLFAITDKPPTPAPITVTPIPTPMATMQPIMGNDSDLAPGFTITTFAGDEFHLADYRGQIVVINFWASWCGPCRYEAPDIQSAWEKYQDQDVMFIGIAWADNLEGALGFVEEFGLTYPNGFDEGDVIGDMYELEGIPTTIILDSEGAVYKRHLGNITERDLSIVLDRLIKAESE